MNSFMKIVEERKILIENKIIHPSSLVDLARNRIMRLKEWTAPDYLMVEAEEVLYGAIASARSRNERN